MLSPDSFDARPIPGGDVMMRVLRFRDRAVLCAALATWAVGPAAAGEAPTSGARRASGPAPVRAGFTVGDVVPSASADAASLPSVDRSTEGLVIETLPGGWRRVNLQGRFRAYSVVTIGADGALHMACADDPAAALAAAGAPPARHARRPLIGPREE